MLLFHKRMILIMIRDHLNLKYCLMAGEIFCPCCDSSGMIMDYRIVISNYVFVLTTFFIEY